MVSGRSLGHGALLEVLKHQPGRGVKQWVGEVVLGSEEGRVSEVLLSGVFEAVIPSWSADGPGAWSGMREGAVCQFLSPCPPC